MPKELVDPQKPYSTNCSNNRLFPQKKQCLFQTSFEKINDLKSCLLTLFAVSRDFETVLKMMEFEYNLRCWYGV